MSFLKKLESGLAALNKKSEEILEITKVKMNRSKLEKQLQEKQRELGRIVYDSYISNTTDSEKVISLCKTMQGLEEEIKKLDEQIAALTPKEKTCPNCGTKVAPDIKFCSNCGTKLIDSLTCSKCGQLLEPDVKFCPKCGNAVVSNNGNTD